MSHQQALFQLSGVTTFAPFQFRTPLSLAMYGGEQWLVFGGNGSGKSFLVQTIRGAYRVREGRIDYDFSSSPSQKVSENIQCVTFHDQYSDNAEPMAYQLRWNQGLLSDDAPTVRQLLDEAARGVSANSGSVDALLLNDLMDKQIIMLSSGEFRRFQIARMLLRRPRLLIIDNPFIGLDEHNRRQVATFLTALISKGDVQLILVTSRMMDDLSMFTHVVLVEQGTVRKMTVDDFRRHCSNRPEPAEVLRLNDVTVRYGSRTILSHLNWTVRRGERWALEGANGAGKSTLLSLVCADNPQAYACDITLFGRRRGTGESIWDIKRHIGYVSPEMFRTYRKPLPVKSIVASGLYDTIGLYRKYSTGDFARIQLWLQLFDILQLQERNYMELSDGEQRLVLLARAFVKDPDLLVLDEPFHGLDDSHRRLALGVIDDFCRRAGKTLIMVSHYREDFPACITHHLKLERN